MHYQCLIASLEDELEKQAVSNLPEDMFSEDLFDACVIELDQLITDLDLTRIYELWHIFSINKRSEHFIVLYDNTAHLCTCLTLINHDIVCRHFFVVMLISPTTRFHIGIVLQRWYTDLSVIDVDLNFSSVNFFKLEHATEINFSHLDTIWSNYVFTKELAKKIETEIVGQVKNSNDIIEFAFTIDNLIGIKTKGQKPKEFDHVNIKRKSKKRETFKPNQNDKENSIDLQKILQDNGSNELTNSETSNKRTCRICNKKGHNV
ncbi:hypothetical protein Glove_19g6 [Diversispora epigaea]|uniref:SWIM-type domain-containing protein n=1 Tax=Diversispora epigaea TaxID=1348612 RepID=A0A397JUN9_9GLOM|nr:hypothetical protein Glove_19g6 [Diversispora epigaea]